MKTPLRELLQPDPAHPGAFDLAAVSGPSFPVSIKIMATAMMLALLVFGAMTFFGPAKGPTPALAAGEWVFLVAVTAVIGTGYWSIVTGRTSCDGQAIEQTWLWRKKVEVDPSMPRYLLTEAGIGYRFRA